MNNNKSSSSLYKYKLRRQLKEISMKRSYNSSTSLVTLYIPPTTKLSDISNMLKNELGTATNIKDKNTGKAVADALRSIISRMQYLKNGEKGLAIFSGITENNKLEYFALEPIEPISIKDYRCDSHFQVDHLKDILSEKDQLGVIVIDRGGATFAVIRGSNLNILKDETSFVPSKHNKGGQSAGRIERGIEILTQEFYGKMAELANHLFLGNHLVSALVVGGPAMSKDKFLEHPSLDYRLKNKIYKIYDVGYTGPSGIRELLSRADNDLKDYSLIKERQLFQKFLFTIGEDDGKAIYGEAMIRKALNNSAVETILYSEGIDKVQLRIKCSSCEKEFSESVNEENKIELEMKIMKANCPICSNEELEIINNQYLLDEFEKLAIDTGATLEIVSTSHEDGLTLLNTFTGLAALLRFPINWD